ncbi:MAG TPA: type II toxin-antitoxin system VapC family toxin [Bryobacteraceae bacterium]|nr:type II toxin-antitoxin system VapC family toxin [Bryobacteraceae bacterium]
MAAYLLDTSVIIDALNGKKNRWELLGSLVEAGDTLACSAITIAEIYADVRRHEASRTQTFLDGLDCYDVDPELARYAGWLKNDWAKLGRTLSISDVLIAATALVHRLVLMTDNRKDFPMPDVTLYPLP